MSKGQNKIGSVSSKEDTEPIKSQTMNEYYGWAKDSICSKPNIDSKIFVSNKLRDIEQAKIFCEICPVKEICLEYAIAYGEYDNVWGGLSGPERMGIMEMKKAS